MTYILILFLGILSGFFVILISTVLPKKRIIPKSKNNTFYPHDLTLKNFFIEICSFYNFKADPWKIIIIFVYPFIYLTLWFFIQNREFFLFFCLLLIYFGIVIIIDIQYKVIFTSVNCIGFILSLLIGTYILPIHQVIMGGFTGFIVMLFFYKMGILFIQFVSKYKKETNKEPALGFADVLLCITLGFLTGFPGIIMTILLGVVFAGLYSAIWILYTRLSRQYIYLSAFPYSPFLIMASFIIIFFNQ